MSFITVSLWTATEITDEMITRATDKFIPMIMSLGASNVKMVRTGDLSMCVVTQYPDATAAGLAQAKIAEIRDQVASEFPMTLKNVHGGEVIGSA
ncbi:MAG: hypothetical protein ACI9RO_001464 [Alteromonas macleodii]|jgi:hypothetical protein